MSKGVRKITRNTSESITIGRAYELYTQEKVAKGVTKFTLINFYHAFDYFIRYATIDEEDMVSSITQEVLYEWTDYMVNVKMNKPNTVNSYLGQLRTFLHWCMKHEYLKRFEITLMKHQEEAIRYYTEDDLKALIRKPSKDASFTEYRSWVVTCFILGTGARVATVSNIKMEDVDLTAREVTYTHLKNKRLAVIPLSNDLCNILNEYLRTWDTGSEFLFCNISSNQLTTGTLSQAFKKYCKGRGVEPIGCHVQKNSFNKCALDGLVQTSKLR